MIKKTKDSNLSIEERLEQALIPNWDEPYKLPNNWCWVHWGNCGQFIAGGAFKEKYQGFSGLPIPFYKVGSLKYSDNNGYLYDETNTIDKEIRNQLKVSLIPANSIIFAKIGEAIRLNRRSLNAIPCCIDNNLMAFAVSDKCYYKYVYYWSKSIDLYKYANATTVPAIRKTDLESIPFPLAPYETQIKIVTHIESLFAKLDEAKEKIEPVVGFNDISKSVIGSIDTMKKGILTRAFRGELGTNNPDEESAVELLKKVLGGDSAVETPAKKPTKRISIPSDIKELLSNSREEEIIKLLLKATPQPVSIQEIMSLSSKKFELMDALRSLEKKQLITKNESGEYSLTR